ncbi:acetyl xylan esterase [Gemella bergeri ATCC 700627]|uniref:Acetyl xylan esterase n=1 Tax=Gemella bergeri ATCC 700627 TaxID=1321820 RepID=U2QQB4_9BACL|nr:alpha/beta fold hydrolase [Gemella bergeri]ERK58696.1 acetyl xylan esterase [Gemella bergeri ATCC 700627]
MNLEKYIGAWKKPNNFDEFWNGKLDEIRQVPLDYKIIKKEFSNFKNIEYYDLYFTSFDGAVIYAKYIKSKLNKPSPVLFYFHGYPASSRNWLEKTAYTSLGYSVLAMDFRGQGGKSEDIGGIYGSTVFGHITIGLDSIIDNLLYVKNIMDMCLLVRIAGELDGVDKNNFVTYGASQGGAFSIMCAALNKNIKKCISLYPFLSDYKKVYDLDRDTGAYGELRLYSRWFNNDEKRNKEIFDKLAYIDTKNFSSKVRAKVLFGMSGVDSDCPLETQYAVFNNLICEKKLCFYKKYDHEAIASYNNEIFKFLLEK